MANKKDRFEVFKRDGFRCQYCGRTPPEVILELDHIVPKAGGGPDNIDNYVTACFDCNRGKSNITLDSIPPALKDKIAEMRERREQVEAYTKFLEDEEYSIATDVQSVNNTFTKYFPGFSLSESFQKTTVKPILRSLPTIKVCEAMELACLRMGHDRERAAKYFCGICYNWIKRPETRNW